MYLYGWEGSGFDDAGLIPPPGAAGTSDKRFLTAINLLEYLLNTLP